MRRRTIFARLMGPAVCVFFFTYLTHQTLAYADFPLAMAALILAWFFILIFGVLMMIYRFWFHPKSRNSGADLTGQRAVYLAQGYLSYILCIVLIRDFIFLCGLPVGSLLFKYDQQETFFIIIAPAVLMGLGRLSVFLGPWVRRVKVEKKDLAADLHNIKIVQISDLHIGPGIHIEKIRQIVHRTNALHPDLIVLTGDIVDHSPQVFHDEIKVLKELKARYGVFYAPGNHEYYWGLQPIVDAFQALGIHVLLNRNEVIRIGDATLAVCGVTDVVAPHFHLPGPNFAQALQGAETSDFKLLLSHQPKTADQAKKLPFDLQVSGHTHSGQFIPWSLMIGLFQKYAKGLYRLERLQLYVNSGTGHWGPPDRLGTFSEISEITLTLEI